MKAYITNIEVYLPELVEENPAGRLRKKTGIERRHICPNNMTAGDMAFCVAEKLFQQGVKRETVDYILLCTQSPDYFLPTTACILQDKLKLDKNCGALDFNLGCSGYVYGLGLVKGLIETNQAKSVLLLTAETYSKYINEKDMATRPLFGDAAVATLIQAVNEENAGIYGFTYGTDGSGAEQLIVPVGGSRNPFSTQIEEFTDKYENYRTNRNLYMNGSGIMDFALEVVPDALNKIFSKTGLDKNSIDYFVFHQANQFMLNFLRQKCELNNLAYWNDVAEYGNTVSCSIPLAIFDMLKKFSPQKLARVLLMGFGVGLSWGGCIVDLRKIQGVDSQNV